MICSAGFAESPRFFMGCLVAPAGYGAARRGQLRICVLQRARAEDFRSARGAAAGPSGFGPRHAERPRGQRPACGCARILSI